MHFNSNKTIHASDWIFVDSSWLVNSDRKIKKNFVSSGYFLPEKAKNIIKTLSQSHAIMTSVSFPTHDQWRSCESCLYHSRRYNNETWRFCSPR